ncbi:hypothetical protein GCM10007972_27140 [Iodidimonas muriae]|uniref:Uncharacterized protein n=1 Tax=Iodidimonas muriae TaxID=261467 RepID=A0ABQ2LGF3_9PROT|nr:hypothetical protein JCM17843_30060 [Kordiimonadales bacterium JCM 17843]GGO17208.1 hypothetical protein GCM10007972_27140 [Iodidimonas muriae]
MSKGASGMAGPGSIRAYGAYRGLTDAFLVLPVLGDPFAEGRLANP